jgi:hypothetical protein
MGQLTLLLVAFAAVAIATLNLGLGFWIGRSTQKHHRRPSMVPRDLSRRAMRRAVRELKECLLAADDLTHEAAALSCLVTSHHPSLPVELVSAMRRMTFSINALEGQLNAGLRSVSSRLRDGSAAGRKHRHPEGLSSTDSPLPQSPNLGFQGQRYNMVQHVAPWMGDGVPDPSTFIPVHCEKLSAAELIYFADEPPDSDRVAVRLRSEQTEIVVGGQVLEHRMAYFGDRWCCRIRCRFVERLQSDRAAVPAG